MKNQFKSIVIIVLLASFASTHAMENPLPEKLGILKTHLETLRDGLQNLKDKLEDLKDELEPEGDLSDDELLVDKEEPISPEEAWVMEILKLVLQREEELREDQLSDQESIQEPMPTEKGLVGKMREFLDPFLPTLPSITPFLSAAFSDEPVAGSSQEVSITRMPKRIEQDGFIWELVKEPTEQQMKEYFEKNLIQGSGNDSYLFEYKLVKGIGGSDLFKGFVNGLSWYEYKRIPGYGDGTGTGYATSGNQSSTGSGKSSGTDNPPYKKNQRKKDMLKDMPPINSAQVSRVIHNVFTQYKTHKAWLEIKNELKKNGIVTDNPKEIFVQLDAAWKTRGQSEPYLNFALRMMLGAEEAARRIKEILEQPNYINMPENETLQKMAKEYKEKNRATRKGSDKELAQHCWERLDAINRTLKNNGRRFDYSKKVKPHPVFTDPYARVFDHCKGTHLDKQLHRELCDTRTIMLELQGKYENNIDVQSYASLVNRITACAKRATDLVTAFNLSDFSRDVVSTISSVILLSGQIALEGTTMVAEAAINMVDPRTYADMAVRVLGLGICLANEEAVLHDLDVKLYASLISNNFDPYLKASAEYQKQWEECALGARVAYEHFKTELVEMPWQGKVRGGARLAINLLLPFGIVKLNRFAASATGRNIFSNLAKVLKSPFAEETMAEVAGIGKIAVEEGSAFAATAVEVIKENPALLTQPAKKAATGASIGAVKVVSEGMVKLSDKVLSGLKNVIKRYEKHIFSDDHKAKGIMALGKSQEAIMDSLCDIIKSVNAKNLLKQGDNQIRATINGISNVEIKCYIKNAEVLSVNAFRSNYSRPSQNIITWP